MNRIVPLLTVALLATPAFADEGAAVEKILTTTKTVTGQPITVAKHPKLQMVMMTIEPGASLPVHKHPYARYAYVEQGTLDVTLVKEEKVLHFKQGDAFAEVIDGWHYGTNNGDVPLKLLVIDQMPQDAATNTVLRDQSH